MFSYTFGQLIGILSVAVLTISLCLILHFTLDEKTENIKKIPQKIITILLVLSEIAKLVFCLISKAYFEIYPFYFCSFFWIWFLLSDFLPECKIKQACQAISFVGSIAVTVLFVVNPTSILGDSLDKFVFSSYLNFHHVLFHSLVVIHLFVSLTLETFTPKKMDFLYILIWILILCAIIVPGAYLTNVNYMNILSSKISFLESIRLNQGQLVYNLTLIVWLAIALELVHAFVYLLYKKFSLK